MRRERGGSFQPSSILSTHSCQTSRLLSKMFSRLSWNIWTWILKDLLNPRVSGWPTKGPVFCWAAENPEAKGDNTITTITTKINIHFFQESNNFEGPPSHIQFVDMPVDSSYMDGVGTFLEIQCLTLFFRAATWWQTMRMKKKIGLKFRSEQTTSFLLEGLSISAK